MQFSLTFASPEKKRSGCLVLGVHAGTNLPETTKKVDAACGGYLRKVLSRGDLGSAPGKTLLLQDVSGLAADRVLLVRCGAPADLNDFRFLQITASASAALNDANVKDALYHLTELEVKDCDAAWKVRQTIIALNDKQYCFSECKSGKKPDKPTLVKVTLAVSGRGEQKAAEPALLEGAAASAGMSLAKDLGNLPGNICTPTYLGQQAKKLARKSPKLKVKVLGEAELKKLGMGSMLSVSAGSAEPAQLIVFEYRNGPAKQKPVALVGKGVTFDTGGISLKPGAAMDEMKYDMCGAASVFGAIEACVMMELPLNVVGIVAAVENMPGSRATKPGDIVTSMSGQTIEVLNTDAEGRLVLCDALTYSERFKPEVVVDMATLTGACIVALGRVPHGLLSNDDELAAELLDVGKSAADRAWQLPLWEDYQSQLDSNFADMANIGGRDAGTITAACFLSRYAKNLRWAHLDIAGTAWVSGKAKGATGRPVPLLTRFLAQRAGG